jgi:hypothetical protein
MSFEGKRKVRINYVYHPDDESESESSDYTFMPTRTLSQDEADDDDDSSSFEEVPSDEISVCSDAESDAIDLDFYDETVELKKIDKLCSDVGFEIYNAFVDHCYGDSIPSFYISTYMALLFLYENDDFEMVDNVDVYVNSNVNYRAELIYVPEELVPIRYVEIADIKDGDQFIYNEQFFYFNVNKEFRVTFRPNGIKNRKNKLEKQAKAFNSMKFDENKEYEYYSDLNKLFCSENLNDKDCSNLRSLHSALSRIISGYFITFEYIYNNYYEDLEDYNSFKKRKDEEGKINAALLLKVLNKVGCIKFVGSRIRLYDGGFKYEFIKVERHKSILFHDDADDNNNNNKSNVKVKVRAKRKPRYIKMLYEQMSNLQKQIADFSKDVKKKVNKQKIITSSSSKFDEDFGMDVLVEGLIDNEYNYDSDDDEDNDEKIQTLKNQLEKMKLEIKEKEEQSAKGKRMPTIKKEKKPVEKPVEKPKKEKKTKRRKDNYYKCSEREKIKRKKTERKKTERENSTK